MEDSQQYLTEGVVTSEAPPSVGGALLIITSEEQFLQLEKRVKTRGGWPPLLTKSQVIPPSP